MDWTSTPVGSSSGLDGWITCLQGLTTSQTRSHTGGRASRCTLAPGNVGSSLACPDHLTCHVPPWWGRPAHTGMPHFLLSSGVGQGVTLHVRCIQWGASGVQVTPESLGVTGLLGPVSRSSVSGRFNGDNFNSGKTLGARWTHQGCPEAPQIWPSSLAPSHPWTHRDKSREGHGGPGPSGLAEEVQLLSARLGVGGSSCSDCTSPKD